MSFRKVLLFLLLVHTSSSLFAYKKPIMYPVFSLSTADAFISTQGTNTFTQGDSLYHYDNDNKTKSYFMPGIWAGIEIPLNFYAVQLGLSYYQPAAMTYAGQLTQGVDSLSYDQYDYHYRILSRDVLIESKWLGTWRERYHPYLSLGMGAAFNYFYGFNVNYPTFLTFTPLWKSQMDTAFAYQVGLGLDMDINTNVRLGIGYRYFNLGHPKFDKGWIDVVPIAGSLEQCISAQVLMAQLTFIL